MQHNLVQWCIVHDAWCMMYDAWIKQNKLGRLDKANWNRMTGVQTDKRTKKSLIEADCPCPLPKNVGSRWGWWSSWQNFVVLLNDLYDAYTANLVLLICLEPFEKFLMVCCLFCFHRLCGLDSEFSVQWTLFTFGPKPQLKFGPSCKIIRKNIWAPNP